jgi:hypothetical protein
MLLSKTFKPTELRAPFLFFPPLRAEKPQREGAPADFARRIRTTQQKKKKNGGFGTFLFFFLFLEALLMPLAAQLSEYAIGPIWLCCWAAFWGVPLTLTLAPFIATPWPHFMALYLTMALLGGIVLDLLVQRLEDDDACQRATLSSRVFSARGVRSEPCAARRVNAARYHSFQSSGVRWAQRWSEGGRQRNLGEFRGLNGVLRGFFFFHWRACAHTPDRPLDHSTAPVPRDLR